MDFFMFNIQDLSCAVENVEGSVSLTANDLYVISTYVAAPCPRKSG